MQKKLSLIIGLSVFWCGFQPALAIDDLNSKTRWQIAKENVDHFFDMELAAIEDLFDENHGKRRKWPITLDNDVALQVIKSGRTNEFSLVPERHVMGGYSEANWFSPEMAETIWTGVPGKKANDYWTIIKVNLDKLVGLNSAEIRQLLGPERCYKKGPFAFMDYRVGNARLRLSFKDEKCNEVTFTDNRYDPASVQ